MLSRQMVQLPFASVSVLDGVILAAVALFLPVGWWVVWRMWRYGDLREQPRNPYSRAQQDRLRRLMPASMVGVTAGWICVAVGLLLGQKSPAEKIAVGVFALIAFAAFAVTLSVDRRDKPRWAIAPVLRDKERVPDPHVGPAGAMALLGARRRQRKKRRRDYQRHDPAPTPTPDDMSDDWLDPETKQWLDRQMHEKQP
jgi:hypothetical protein